MSDLLKKVIPSKEGTVLNATRKVVVVQTPQTNGKTEDPVVVVQATRNATNQPVFFSKKNANDASRVASNSLVGSGIEFLSCDEKDVYINPWNLAIDLQAIKTPNLNSMSPITVNYAADGFPRIDGKAWNGGKDDQEEDGYDPSDPSTLVSYGLVVDKQSGALPFPVLGFRIKCHIFDTELGSSTVGIRAFCGDYEHEVLNALISILRNDAEIIVPFFSENIVRSTAGNGDWTKEADETLKFVASTGSRDGSYNLVFAPPVSTPATISDLPSFFTVTGQNVYTYVSPIMANDSNVSRLIATLKNNPSGYLAALQQLS
jgi:hypothetical protein